MHSLRNQFPPRQPLRQQGAALFISLMFLIILTVIGLSAANVGVLQERMASNVRESNEAFQVAEGTLRFVERELGRIVSGATGGDLVVEIWEDVRGELDIGRHSCTLTKIAGGEPALAIEDEDWISIDIVSGYESWYYIAALTDSGDSGAIFGSACRPMNELNDTAIEEYYVITARARALGAAERSPAEAIVQSIYFYPE